MPEEVTNLKKIMVLPEKVVCCLHHNYNLLIKILSRKLV